eukprot:s4221_g7.t1
MNSPHTTDKVGVKFGQENSDLLNSLTMIIVEVHARRGDSDFQMVEKLQSNGWSLKQSFADQRVLCKGPCINYCDDSVL